MGFSVDEDTRVVSNRETSRYLDQKSKRDLLRRVAFLEDKVTAMNVKIEALLSSKESKN